MSLLQDALRRAQKSAGIPRTTDPGPFPEPPSRKPKTRWKLLLGLVAAAFLLGGAGVFLLSRPSSRAYPPIAHALPAPALPAPPGAAEEAVSPPASPLPASPVEGKTSVRTADRAGSRRSAPASVPPEAGLAAGGLRSAESGGDPVLGKFNAAAAALDRGDAAEAVRLFREVTAVSPNLVEAWNGLGLGLLRQQKLDGADEAFSRTLALSPRYVPGLINAGLLRLAEGRVEEGAALFSRAAEISPGSPAPRVNLAVAQARQGRFGEAEETLLRARIRFPGHPDVLYQLGTVYERMGDREKSADAYDGFLSASGGSRPELEERVRERLRSWNPRSRLDAVPSRPPE